MNRSQWHKIEGLFNAALEQPAGMRAAWLDEACAGDPTLRVEVEALLASHATDPEFLGTPVIQLGRDLPPIPLTPEHEGGIGPYRVVREIGAGGMGVVYLAIHQGAGFERPVALKVIRRGLSTDDLLRRFQLERRILAALKHPNVARLTDAGQTPDGRPYFVMDYVDGAPIDVYCDREQLPLRRRLALFQTVCGAVQHAHNNLVVHRDIKPGNVLVSRDGEPVLLDFGIGKLLDGGDADRTIGTDLTRTGLRAFTPQYAAPEQLRGEPIGVATDVYGLGVLLYRLLTGKRPFDADDATGYERMVLEREPTPPSARGIRELAGDLDTIVLKALRREPERRYSSVAALSDDVQRYLDGLPVRARPDTLGYRAGKFANRHRLALTAGFVVMASLVGATVYSRGQTRAVMRERDKAIEVQTFLLEMFGSMGPGRSDSVSVRQLLDGQAALAQATYGDRPELLAQMQMVIGEGYDRLGLFAPAESLFSAALATRRSVLPGNHADIALAASMLGWVNFERGRANDGEALLREAVDRWPKASPYNAAMHARSMNDLGVLLEARGRYDEAVDLYRRALVTRKRLFGDSNRAVAVTGNNLAMALARKGDLRAGAAMAETALSVMRRVSGPDHQRSTIIQGNLANLRSQLGDVDGATREYRDLMARQIRVSGAQHPVTAFTQLSYGSVLRSQGKLAEAESLLVQAHGNLIKVYGAEHTRVALAMSLLGGVRSEQGRWAEARPMLERAVAIQRKLRGNGHRETGQALSALAGMHANAGDWTESETRLREALGIMIAALGESHLETARIRAQLASVVRSQGRLAESRSLYERARSDLVTAGVLPASPLLQDIARALARN